MATRSDEILEQSSAGFRRSPRKRLFVWGAAVALVLLSGLFAGVGIAGLVAASLLNVWLRMKQLKSR